ncbi:MAG: hypothetical protein AAFS07_03065 [Pseudomonadota bacterium]
MYAAREGSSAILHALSAQPDILVPVFEAMDRYAIVRNHQTTAEFPEIFEQLWETGSYGDYFSSGRNSLSPPMPEQTPDRVSAMGFKWRPHGDPVEITRILGRQDVKVFVLLRRDFAELIASLLVSDRMSTAWADDERRRFHSQFMVRRASPEQRSELRDRLDRMEIPLNRKRFLMRATHRILAARNLRKWAERLSHRGLPIHVLHYEDFLTQPTVFMQDIMTDLGIARPFEPARRKSYEKLSKKAAADRIEGFRAWMRSPVARALEAAYRRELARVARLTPQDEARAEVEAASKDLVPSA